MSSKLSVRGLLASGILTLWAAAFLPAASTWTEADFKSFRDGTFFDAGSNLYVSAKGRIQLINRWDLNGDGFVDVVMPSGHGHTEKEDTYVYLNNGHGDIDGRSLIRVPSNGGYDGVVADFDKDGRNDLAVCNYDNGITPDLGIFIYFGSEEGWTAKRRQRLPGIHSTAIVAGDFNNDGWTDLLAETEWQEDYLENKGEVMSLLYWNSPEGFKPENRQTFAEGGNPASAIGAGDLDGDKIPDPILVLAGRMCLYLSGREALKDPSRRVEVPLQAQVIAVGNFNGDQANDLALVSGNEVWLLAGSEGGFSKDSAIRLEAKSPHDLALADFDGDGMDDVAIANHAGADGATWVESYVYFADGGNFTKKPRITLPTLGANAVSAGDLNGDGRPDLVFSNLQVTNQKVLPSPVYWNTGGTFNAREVTLLGTQGTTSNTIGDANNDGQPDVIYFNLEGNFRDGASVTRIFWGDGTRDFTIQRTTEFQTHYLGGGAHADLDDDGLVDLVLTQQRFIGGVDEKIYNPLTIYWGDGADFSQRSSLTMDEMVGAIRVVDFNHDGYLDMLVGGTATDPVDPKKKGMAIFWGAADGFYRANRTVIDLEGGSAYRAPVTADFNRDGYLDLATQLQSASEGSGGLPKNGKFHILWGNENPGDYSMKRLATVELETKETFGYFNAADLNKDGWLDLVLPVRMRGRRTETPSYVYFGSADGFSNDAREVLPGYAATDIGIADYNRDGWLDICFHSYKDDTKRDAPAQIYWGSEKGFLARPATQLPAHSSAGVENLDYDGDGWIDILLYNHTKDGSTTEPGPQNHVNPTYLYWGGPDGFHPERRTDFPGIGPHAFVERDPGNIADRGLFEEYISSPQSMPAGERPARLSWAAETPHGTAVTFQLRAAADREALADAAWTGPTGPETWFAKSGASLEGIAGQWIQYRARLATPNGGATPYLTLVSIDFE